MPIFIVGFPRSGTTLAQKLVSQHLAIPTLPETHYFEFLTAHEPAGGHLTSAGANALVEQLGGFLKIDLQALRQLLGRDEVPIRALFLQIIAQQIGSQALADKGQWLEKTPGHAEHLERIVQMFPKARFLCMVRNPLHAFASRRELLEPGKGWGEEWKPIEAYCSLWAQHVKRMREFAERHPGQLQILRLEDLAGDPQSQLARVREFVGAGFANTAAAPLEPGIVQPFETWKRDALKPADPAIADREGKVLLDPFETWRVKTLLREEMSLLGYPVDTLQPTEMDDLHLKLIMSVDWYREQFARRDALMDVKTTRIRGLLNQLAELKPDAVPAAAPRPSAAAVAPIVVASARPVAEPVAMPKAEPRIAEAKPVQALVKPAGKVVAKPAAKRPAARDDDDDSFPAQRPILLRGISGVNDNASEFLAQAAKAKKPLRAADDDE